MKTGLYFGSFNPVHIGHLIVADALIEAVGFEEVWLVVSPQSPFKPESELAPEQHRKEMAELAAATHDRLIVSTVEFDLPRPSYTIDTIRALQKEYPGREFSLIMGMDNLLYFDKWKDHEEILRKADIHVYDRAVEEEIPEEFHNHPGITIHRFPLINVSSTRLRENTRKGKSIKYWVPADVEAYILDNGLYR